MGRWIKLHDKIMEHWLSDNPEQFLWWTDILFETNYADKEWVIGDQVFEVKRGECLYSLETWAKRWKTDKTAARRFLLKLEKCKMIKYKNETVTIRVTVCNYDTYQYNPEESETQTKRSRNANETQTKSTKEGKKERKTEDSAAAPISFTEPSEQILQFKNGTLERWNQFTSLWQTTEDPEILNKKVKKKYWDQLSVEVQENLVKMVQNLGSDISYLKQVWISECFRDKTMNTKYLQSRIDYYKKNKSSKEYLGSGNNFTSNY